MTRHRPSSLREIELIEASARQLAKRRIHTHDAELAHQIVASTRTLRADVHALSDAALEALRLLADGSPSGHVNRRQRDAAIRRLTDQFLIAVTDA